MKVHALNPDSLRTHFEMYVGAMHRPSPLSRAERELVAVVVSRLNGCDGTACGITSPASSGLLPDDRHHVAPTTSRPGGAAALDGREAALIRLRGRS